MSEIISQNGTSEICDSSGERIRRRDTDFVEFTEGILRDTHTDISTLNAISIPIAALSALGAGAASLIPALRTVTQTTVADTQGLFRLVNAGAGDALKVAKNRNYWGALKTAEGTSKLAQFQAAGSLSATSTAVMPIDPVTIMMAVALFSIEQQLGNIAEMEKRILSFLEVEKESEIEADVKTLSDIIKEYKHNWDNEHFIASNHKMVLDIQRTARKHMVSYQKKVREALNSKQFINVQAQVNSDLKDLYKKFNYYRLSLYTFSMASFIEIMLSGNFKEEYITDIKSEIETLSYDYRELFTRCSLYLEKKSAASLDTNVLKGIGAAGKAVGEFIGSIPVVKEGQMDELLQKGGSQLRQNAQEKEQEVLLSFAKLSNPETGVFIDKMTEMIRIYNHTSAICFDEKQIYLVAG